MEMKLLVLSVFLAACNAGPVWIDGDDTFPGVILRVGRSPNMAFSLGSAFSSNIGGIAHSTSMGSSFQNGDAEAYGAGVAGHNVYTRSPGNNAYTKAGVSNVNAVPIIYSAPHPYQHSSAAAYNNGYAHNVNSAASQAQSFGHYNSAVSSAQNLNRYGSAGLPHYQTAVASAKNTGLGYFARNGLGYNSAASSAQTGNGFEYNAAVSAAENMGGYGGSSSQAIQQRAGLVRNSGASSINGPGLQAAQSHAVNTDLF